MPHHYPLLPLPQNTTILNNHYPTLISQPVITSQRRKTPCEPCRDKKRRCDFAKPSCSRCISLESICTYIEPIDSAAAKQRNNSMTGTLLAMELEDLHDKMDMFEHDIDQFLKDTENMLLTQSTMPPSTFLGPLQELSKSEEEAVSVVRAVKVKKRRHHSFSADSPSSVSQVVCSPSLSLLPSKVNWRVQLSRRGFRIETNIQHYSDFVQFMTNGLAPASILHDSTPPITVLTPHCFDASQLYECLVDNIYHYHGRLWSYVEEDPSKKIATDYRKKLALNLQNWQDEISQTENQWLLRYRYNIDDFNAEELEEIYYINSEDKNGPDATAKFSISPRGRWDDIIDHYLNCYFTCLNNDLPYIDEKTVRERFFSPEKRNKSILVYALAAATAGRECRHINASPSHLSDLIPTYAGSLFEAFALHAHRLLRDRFDTEDLETFLALISMATYAMIHFKVIRAGIYHSMSLRLGNVLLSHYFSDLNQPNPQACSIEIEMFKRAYWLNTQMAIGFNYLGGQTPINVIIPIPFSDFKPFPIELESTYRGLLFAQFTTSTRIVELSKIIYHQLGDPHSILSTKNVISKQFITDMEYQLVHIWHLANSKIKLPLDRADKIAVEDVPNQAALRMTILYHGVWMSLHERFLSKDGEPPNRSLMICTHAAHVISHLYNLLAYIYNPCHTDTQTLFKACHIHYRNMYSSVPEIRTRARMSLRQSIQTIRYVHGQLGSEGNKNFFCIHRESWKAFERSIHAITIEDSDGEEVIE